MSNRKVLVLFAHPVLERSRVNRRLLEAVEDLVTVNDLYERYPTFDIQVQDEQELLSAHDVVIFQHPFYWYSCPAILKEWQDLVLEHGWAYGADGDRLRGKITFNAISTGGPATAYQADGYNRFTIRELLTPWDQTAHLCGMRFLAPFVVHSALRVATDNDMTTYQEQYRSAIEALREGTLDLAGAEAAAHLGEVLDSEPSP